MEWNRRLNELKKVSGKTLQEISDISGIALGTLNKIFAGQTKDPQLSTIYEIVHAIGYTLDDLVSSEHDSLEWGFPILSAYQGADESTQRAACAVLRIGYVKAPGYMDDIETLAAHSDGIPADEVQSEVAAVLRKLERKK